MALSKGLLGGIVGEISLVSCDDGLGHTFIVYKSYINDVFDFSNYYGGYQRNSIQQDVFDDYVIYNEVGAIKRYCIKPGESVTIGNFMEDNVFLKGGLYFNREVFNYIDRYIGKYEKNYNHYDYKPNSYITRQIKGNELKFFLDEIDNDGKSYNLFFYNCVDVALNAWTKTFDDEFESNLEMMKQVWLLATGSYSMLPSDIRRVIKIGNHQDNFDLGTLI